MYLGYILWVDFGGVVIYIWVMKELGCGNDEGGRMLVFVVLLFGVILFKFSNVLFCILFLWCFFWVFVLFYGFGRFKSFIRVLDE